MVFEYFKTIINTYETYDTTDINRKHNTIACLFINNQGERMQIKQTIEFNIDPSKMKLSNIDILNKYFTQEDMIKLGKTMSVCVSDYSLFEDDTIEELKLKLFFTMKQLDVIIKVEQLYMFSNGYSTSILSNTKDAEQLYRVLSENKKRLITWDILCELLLNCGDAGINIIKSIDKKMYYFYDDFKPYENDIKMINAYYTPLSYYLTTTKKQLSFIHNPDSLTLYLNNLFNDEPRFYKAEYDYFKIQNKLIQVSKLLTENTVELLSTNNAKALYDFTINDNTIYCYEPFNIRNQLENFERIENILLRKYISSLYSSFYFPKIASLYDENGVLDNAKFTKETNITIDKYSKEIEKYDAYFNKIEHVYSIKNDNIQKKQKYSFISNMSGTYYQTFPFLFPCETIFKKIKTNKLMPYAKYNPGLRQEPINRLFISGLTSKGKKVPDLNKSDIQKLNKKNSIEECILYYFTLPKTLFNYYNEQKLKDTESSDTITNTKDVNYIMDSLNKLLNTGSDIPEGNYEIKIVIYANSSISYNFSCNNINKHLYLDAVEHILRTICTPLFEFIRNELISMGPDFDIMPSLRDANFEIDTLDVVMLFENIRTANLDFDKYMPCVSKFITKQERLKKADDKSMTSFMYKRISNYTKLNAIESSIIQLINVGYGEQSIVRFLENNYAITEIEAKQYFLNVISQINVEMSVNPNRRLRIKNNPGLNYDIMDVPFSNNLTIEIRNITSLNLLDIINNSSLNILTIVSNSITDDQIEDIRKICSVTSRGKKEKAEFDVIEEIKDNSAVVENPINSNEPSSALVKNLIVDRMQARAISFDDIEDSNTGDNDKVVDLDNLDNLDNPEELDNAFDNDLLDLLLNEDDKDGLDDPDEITYKTSPTVFDKDKDVQPAESDELDELEMFGGNDKNPLDGMSLSNPNPFFDKMVSLDPKLYLKKKSGQFNAYSRMCPWNVKRQPVILTKEELDKIDREHPGSYDKSLKYGSSEDKEYYYICPRYWCLKNNVSLTEEEVKAGACGGVDAIIPKDAKKVPPGKYIFEFYADSEHKDTDGSYIKHYPGFLSGDKHPDGLCIPCCFKAWDSVLQKKRRSECLRGSKEKTRKGDGDGDGDGDGEISKQKLKLKKDTEKVKSINTEQDDKYIMGVDKFPLPTNRWAMLPIEIQAFLNINNNDCFEDIETHKLKQNTKCLLRQGVELNNRKSFIAALANAYSMYLEGQYIHSIKSMCSHIASSITLDNYIEAQNGSLVSMFFSQEEFKKINTKLIEEHKHTNIYKLTDFNNFSQQIYFKRVLASFIRFKKYLNDNNSYINHEILWDIVSMPNPKLFTHGINLIILNIPDDDMTNNVEIICPTNAYSSIFYNPRKFTLLLIKKNDFYEPIYIYEETPKRINIQKMFIEFSPILLPKLKEFLVTIKEFLLECQSKQNIKYAEIFEKGNALNLLVRAVSSLSGEILNYVVNSSKKIVGIIVNFERKDEKHENIYIPCFPTSLTLSNLTDDEIKRIITYDEVSGTTLSKTLDGLSSFNTHSTKIHTKPHSLVNENNIIVGVITNTNQFVPINPPLKDTHRVVVKTLKTLGVIYSHDERTININLNNENNNENNNNIMPSLNKKGDIKKQMRVLYNKYKLSILEEELFQKFRNKLKVLLQMPKHNTIRNSIEEIIQSANMNTAEKMSMLIKNIKILIQDHVVFYNIKEFDEYIETLNYKKQDHYYYVEDIQSLILPKINLMNPSIDNSVYYVEKCSDELLRYSRIYEFLMNRNYNSGYLNADYNLDERELLILSDELGQSYFDDIVVISKYYDIIYSLDFYNAKPQIEQNISNVVKKEKTPKKKRLVIKRDKNQKPKLSVDKDDTKQNKRKTKIELSKPDASQSNPDLKKTPLSDKICKVIKSDQLRPKWKKILGSNLQSNIYDQGVLCSYRVICDIINFNSTIKQLDRESDTNTETDRDATKKEITPTDLRKVLSTTYNSFNVAERKELLSSLSNDGKKEFVRKLRTNTIPYEDLPYLSDYYVSLTDILFLSKHYKLPLVLLTRGVFKQFKTSILFTKYIASIERNNENKDKDSDENSKYEIDDTKHFFILKQSGIIRNEPFVYELITYYNNDVLLKIPMFITRARKYLNTSINKKTNIKQMILTDILY
jgi:hypothetical protein